MTNKDDHYLKQELYALIQNDLTIFEFLQEGSLDGIWYWNLENPESEWMSPRFWEILGYNPVEKKHLVEEWQHLIHPDDLKLALENFKAHIADANHPYDQIVRYQHANGSPVWVRCRGIAIRDASGKPIRMLGAHNDVTALKNAEAKLKQQAEELVKLNSELEKLATRDSLTNLYNRRVFNEHLEFSLASARRNKEYVSVLLLDLDHFKKINDTYGHNEGDAVLVSVAKTLQTTIRDSDLLARYGGEEFVVLLPQSDQSGSLTVAEKVRTNIKGITVHNFPVTASVGVATVTPHTSTEPIIQLASTLMVQADSALYAAKKSGRDRSCHFINI